MSLVFATTFFFLLLFFFLFLFFFLGGGGGVLRHSAVQTDFEFEISGSLVSGDRRNVWKIWRMMHNLIKIYHMVKSYEQFH